MLCAENTGTTSFSTVSAHSGHSESGPRGSHIEQIVLLVTVIEQRLGCVRIALEVPPKLPSPIYSPSGAAPVVSGMAAPAGDRELSSDLRCAGSRRQAWRFCPSRNGCAEERTTRRLAQEWRALPRRIGRNSMKSLCVFRSQQPKHLRRASIERILRGHW
jgi:hypothetical protein